MKTVAILKQVNMKYLILDEMNNQEVIEAKDDQEAIRKTLEEFGITILKLDSKATPGSGKPLAMECPDCKEVQDFFDEE